MLLAFFNQLLQSSKFLFAQLLLPDQVRDEQAWRIAEKAADQVPNRRQGGLFAFDERVIHERLPVFRMADVPLVFEDTERVEDGGVGEFGVRQGLKDVG